MISLLAALQFLTIAPPLVHRPFAATEMGRAVGFFPLVGALLGGILIGLDYLLELCLPTMVASALLLAGWVLLTGALHLDGFLDTCDGLFGGREPEDRLRIMRDERVGAFAVIGGVLLLLTKYAALVSLPNRGPALLLAPTLGRWGMVLAIVFFPYARPEGLGRDIKDHAGRREVILADVAAILVVAAVALWSDQTATVLIAVLVAGLTAVILARFVLTRLPGLTGDIYGAICEVVEVLVLVIGCRL